MFSGTCRRFGRALVAGACAASLALPASVRAAEPEGPAPSTAETSDELNDQAQKHATRAVDHFNKGNYVNAEEEFRRVAFFAPNWRPMHFNLAVLAEAQGKLGTAVSEYQAFRPHASPDEQLVVDQRIDELGRRRMRIAGAYKRQMGLGAGTLALGLGGLGGGVAMLVIHVQRKEAYEEAQAWNTMHLMGPLMDAKKPSGALVAGGYWIGLFGIILAGVGVGLLVQSVKSKRKLDSIALGKTRLQWTGGAGVRLRF
ncbi:hypothetical protein OV090_39300 [Nannocystis sp. RBIL2]|uniref:hypothetical protein n=1 Tax=Nannocystis sp. RBIL2 TaxID=2996788 RepID=UPI00227024F6|nr:hypothetical protein [Nannocystis sp. RBIL2]MCY1070855.1 hypothetical protein [Nannocystis sp. RBIL2]